VSLTVSDSLSTTLNVSVAVIHSSSNTENLLQTQLSCSDTIFLLPTSSISSVQHVMAMVLVKAKEVAANANGNVGIADAVMAVPHWFTDAQRKGRIL
jgi:molecular chaperone DnaK (HSP70)